MFNFGVGLKCSRGIIAEKFYDLSAFRFQIVGHGLWKKCWKMKNGEKNAKLFSNAYV